VSHYIYCFALGEELAPLRGLTGVWGREVERLDHGRVTAVVSELEKGCAVTPDRGAVGAHNRVVDAVLAMSTPIPCRFGNVMEPEYALMFVESNYAALLELLEKFSGCVEMNIQIAPETRTEPESESAAAAQEGKQVGEGTRFLRMKQARNVAEDFRKKQIEGAVIRLKTFFEDSIQSTAGFVVPGAAAGEAAHLVKRADLEQYQLRFLQVKSEMTDVCLSLGEPRAPYSFVTRFRPPKT
jgi:hypothetical protein